jgi:hypothetical protein
MPLTLLLKNGDSQEATVSDTSIEAVAAFGSHYQLRVEVPLYRNTYAKLEFVD